jgi:hypothetical protein
MANEWTPKFKVGDCIKYNGDEMCISIVDEEKKNYTFNNNQGSASGYFVDNGFERGDNKIEPAVLISPAAAGGRNAVANTELVRKVEEVEEVEEAEEVRKVEKVENIKKII